MLKQSYPCGIVGFGLNVLHLLLADICHSSVQLCEEAFTDSMSNILLIICSE